MNGTASAAVSVLTRPFARIPEAQRRRIGLVLLIAAALAFPLLHGNDADIDSWPTRRPMPRWRSG